MTTYYHASSDGSVWMSESKWEPFPPSSAGWKSASALTPVAINCTSPEMALKSRAEFMKALLRNTQFDRQAP